MIQSSFEFSTHWALSFSFQLTGIIQAMVDGQPSLQQVLEVGGVTFNS